MDSLDPRRSCRRVRVECSLGIYLLVEGGILGVNISQFKSSEIEPGFEEHVKMQER